MTLCPATPEENKKIENMVMNSWFFHKSVGKSRSTVVPMEKDERVMVITIALLPKR